MSDPAILARIDALTDAVLLSMRMQGGRLSRQQICERLGVCRQTLSKRVASKDFPPPTKDGNWLLCDVVEYEIRAKRGY